MRRQNGDTILGFIFIGLILLALVIAGLSVVRGQVRSSSAQQPSSAQSPSPPRVEEDNTPTKSTNTTPTPSKSVPPANTTLPQTGPVLNVVSLMTIFLLVFISMTYLQSRRI